MHEGFSREKREPEGACGVFYQAEPRGGSELLQRIGEVAEVRVSGTPVA